MKTRNTREEPTTFISYVTVEGDTLHYFVEGDLRELNGLQINMGSPNWREYPLAKRMDKIVETTNCLQQEDIEGKLMDASYVVTVVAFNHKI